MIARVWREWTKTEDAGAYEKLLRDVVYPGLQKIPGYHGGYILRQDNRDEAEFVTVNLFEWLTASPKSPWPFVQGRRGKEREPFRTIRQLGGYT